MEQEREILAFLRALFAGEPLDGAAFTRIPESDALKVLVYFYCRQQLPEDQQKELQKTYYAYVVGDMRRRTSLEKIRAVLDDAGIAFYPLKGCELAYEYYPDPVLRYSGDVDILTAGDDAVAAFQRIMEAGWKPLHEFQESGKRHLPDLIRKNFCPIEVHQYLFRCDAGENQRLMEILREDPHSPELLLVHLMHHAICQHHWQNAMKTVIDVGMVLRKNTVDPDKYRALAREFQVENLLEAVLASFPDVYPEAWRQMFPVSRLDDDTRRAIRAFALDHDALLQGYSDREMIFLTNQGGFKAKILRQLKGLSPAMLGVVYHLSPRRARFGYPWYLLCYLTTRSWRFALILLRGRRLEDSDCGRMYRALDKLTKNSQ